jgi:hypothetical protein
MSNLLDLAINTTAEASEVLLNDTAVKTYLQTVQHRDKVSPWAFWTETYYLPYVGRIEDQINIETTNLNYIKGYVPEDGRRFLGGDIHVTRSSNLNNSSSDSASAQMSSSGDKVLVHMQRLSSEGSGRFLTSKLLQNGLGVVEELSKHYSEQAQKLEDADRVRFLCYPRLYSNDPTVRNNSLELPVDSNYINNGEYWVLFFEPLSGTVPPTGKGTDVGWYGVTVNLRFGSLLEA